MTPSLATLLPTPAQRRLDIVDLAAPPTRVWRAVSGANLARVPVVHVLLALRELLHLRAPGATSLSPSELRSSAEQPGFQLLVEDAPHCLIVGAIARTRGAGGPWIHVADAAEFAAFSEAGAVKLAWSVELRPLGAKDTRLLLERRASGTDSTAWRRLWWQRLGLGPLERLVQRRWFAYLAGEFGAAELVHGRAARAARAAQADAGAGRLHAGAVVWLFAGMLGGPCDDPGPAPELLLEPAATGSSAAGASGGSPPQLPEPAAAPVARVPAPAQTPTTRHYMLTHYADTVSMRKALVSGDLAGFRLAAGAVAKDEWTPRLRGDYRPHIDALRSAAHSGEAAASVALAAAALAKLGDSCAACHLKFGDPGSPVAPEQLTEATNPSMVAHALATDRLWAGLVLPSDPSWSGGLQLLLDAPELAGDGADAARQLRDLARQGKDADVARRGEIFAKVLATCAGCHAQLRVTPKPAP